MIDLSTLKNLMGNDETMVQKFLDIFKNQTPIQLGQLKDFCSDKDWDNVSNTAHALKSQAKYLGLNEIAELAYQIERNAEARNDLETIYADIQVLERDLDEVLRSFQ